MIWQSPCCTCSGFQWGLNQEPCGLVGAKPARHIHHSWWGGRWPLHVETSHHLRYAEIKSYESKGFQRDFILSHMAFYHFLANLYLLCWLDISLHLSIWYFMSTEHIKIQDIRAKKLNSACKSCLGTINPPHHCAVSWWSVRFLRASWLNRLSAPVPGMMKSFSFKACGKWEAGSAWRSHNELPQNLGLKRVEVAYRKWEISNRRPHEKQKT